MEEKKMKQLKTAIITLALMRGSHLEFNNQVLQMLNYLLDHREELGFVATHPNGKWFDAGIKDTYTPYNTIFGKWKDPAKRTIDVISDLELYEGEMRKFYSTVHDIVTVAPYVTNSQLRLLGFPERNAGGGRTPAEVAKTYPVVTVITRLIGHLGFSLGTYDSENKVRKHKPAGQHGAEFRWTLSESPVDSIDLFEHSDFTTKTDYVLDFKNPERGKTLYFAARWENRRGEKGPWSPIYSAIIP
jgi:hypothetical protein